MVVGVLGVVTSCVLCARVSRVLRDWKTTGRISGAIENTYSLGFDDTLTRLKKSKHLRTLQKHGMYIGGLISKIFDLFSNSRCEIHVRCVVVVVCDVCGSWVRCK